MARCRHGYYDTICSQCDYEAIAKMEASSCNSVLLSGDWTDRNESMPKEKPHRNIEIRYLDAVGQEFTARVSSWIVKAVRFTHWREVT